MFRSISSTETSTTDQRGIADEESFPAAQH
jgi:hypothetical protein